MSKLKNKKYNMCDKVIYQGKKAMVMYMCSQSTEDNITYDLELDKKGVAESYVWEVKQEELQAIKEETLFNSKIFVLCGFSACGKDTLLSMVTEQSNIIPVISHTSRPQRDGELNGREYNFINKEDFITMIDNDEVIEYREYNTLVQGKKDSWFYGVTKRAIREDEDNIVVLDTRGAKAIKEIYGDRATIIYIHVADEEREARAKMRGSFDQIEWDRRLDDDRNIFNSGIIKSFDYVINNEALANSVQRLREIICSKR